MSSEQQKNQRTQIIVAIIGLVGVIGAALVPIIKEYLDGRSDTHVEKNINPSETMENSVQKAEEKIPIKINLAIAYNIPDRDRESEVFKSKRDEASKLGQVIQENFGVNVITYSNLDELCHQADKENDTWVVYLVFPEDDTNAYYYMIYDIKSNVIICATTEFQGNNRLNTRWCIGCPEDNSKKWDLYHVAKCIGKAANQKDNFNMQGCLSVQ